MTPLYPPIALGISCLIGEAGNQGRAGMTAVAETIRNRMERRLMSDGTVAGTVLRYRQYSCFDERWRWSLFLLSWDEPRVILARQAWDIAFNDDGTGRRSDLTKGATHYHTVRDPGRSVAPAGWPPAWAQSPSFEKTATIGDHVFYKEVR